MLLTFDHELSLGGAEDYARNLFDPTHRVLDLAGELGVRATLFTDVLCGLRMAEWEPERFAAPYREQLGRALADGHDVQLHLHPHWLTSRFEGGRFVPSTDYTLSHFGASDPPDDIAGIVHRGAESLRTWCVPSDPGYRCVAYRAGGFNLAPGTGQILGALWDEGIRIDSSVVKGLRFESTTSRVDYTRVPAAANWRIDPAGPIDRPANDGLYEIPVASSPRTPWNNLPFLAKRILRRGRAYASGGRSLVADQATTAGRLRRLLPRSAWVLGFDRHTDSVDDVLAVLRRHVARHAGDEEITCAAVSHPKEMGSHARALMRGFVEAARREWGERISFPTCREVHDELDLGGGRPCP